MSHRPQHLVAHAIVAALLFEAASGAQSAAPPRGAGAPHPELAEPGPDGCRTCHDNLYAGAFVHASATGPSCEGCHVFDGAGDLTRVRLAREATRERALPLCGPCHEAVASTGRAAAHAPVLVADCLRCHSMHGERRERLLSGPVHEVCLSCHPATRADLARAVAHPPAAADCTICHLPHASRQPHLLRAAPARLCLECHVAEDQRAGLGEPATVTLGLRRDTRRLLDARRRVRLDHGRGEGAEAACVGCHAPHGSSRPALGRD